MAQKKLYSKLNFFFWILLYVCISLMTGVCVYWFTFS